MRRSDLVVSSKRVLADLEALWASDFYKSLMGPTGSRGDGMLATGIGAYTDFLLSAGRYNNDDLEVLSKLGLDHLLDTQFWGEILDAKEGNVPRTSFFALRFAVETFPRFIELIETKAVQLKREANEVSDENAVLTLILPESNEHFSSPQRLVLALQSIEEIYGAVALLHNHSESDLRLIGCDSGSDKSFDFLGAAALVREVREIIFQTWDRISMHRHLQLEARMNAVSSSLPVLEKIQELKEKEAITPESAEIMKRQILSGVSKFLKCGAYSEDIQKNWVSDAKTLAEPERTLLLKHDGSVDHSDADSRDRTLDDEMSEVEESETDSVADFSPEDINRLRSLLDAAKQEEESPPVPKRPTRKRPKRKS